MLEDYPQTFFTCITDLSERKVSLKCLISVFLLSPVLFLKASSSFSCRFHSLSFFDNDRNGAQGFAKLGMNRFVWFMNGS